jgi:WD40 repeat protein
MTSFMQLWSSRPICEGYRPRQFEYHPTRADLLVFGTMEGEVAVANHESNEVLNVDRWAQGPDHEGHNSILGLCWLRRHPTKFLAGSSYGTLNICDFAAPTGEDVDGTTGGGGGGGGGGGVTGGGSDAVDSAVGGDGAAGAPSASASSSATVGGIQTHKFEHFEKLTSVHVNCADAFVVASGYCNSVKVYDVGTAKVVSTYEDIHTDHINISRFTNHSPAIFGTSSFDKTVKLWDLRADSKRGPIYCRTSPSNQGHVMLCFSPNDQYAEEERKRSDLQRRQ